MKPYVKPELFYESFEMNQSIAACALDMSNENDVFNCEANEDPDITTPFDGAINVFVQSNSECDVRMETYCYTNAMPTANVFNS